MNRFLNHINNHLEKYILLVTIIISILSFLYFYLHGQQNLADYDAIARLNIARKMVDSLTPGVGQLGGIWLPFPQIFMIPFIWNDFLWHSGLGGAIVSMIAYIIGALFIYKIVYLITKNKLASIIAWFVFALNINLLLLQTMAMSESFFLMGICLVVYFLIKWIGSRYLPDLIYTAFFLTIITLTRYEGYFVFIASIVCVLISAYYMFVKDKDVNQRKKMEGIFILFITLASLGIIIWMIYSALFYKDPLYWLHLYSGQANLIPGASIQPTDAIDLSSKAKSARSIFTSAGSYTWAMALMNGIIITILGIIGLFLLMIENGNSFVKKKINLKILPICIISLLVLIFLIIGYYKGLIPPIDTPVFSLNTILTKDSNNVAGGNIRYGLIALPFFAIFVGYLASRKKIIAIVVLSLIIFQLFTYFFTNLFFTYQLPEKWHYNNTSYGKWFKDNYDDGLILISAHRYEPFMLEVGIPYKRFIYEGTRDYWKDSLKDPSKYAKWVIYNKNQEGDAVAENIVDFNIINDRYDLMYKDGSGLVIYKIKTHPQIEIKN